MNVFCPPVTVAMNVVEVGLAILTITPQLQTVLAFLPQVILQKYLVAALLAMATLVAVVVAPVVVVVAPVAVPAVVEVAVEAAVEAVIKNDHHLRFSDLLYKRLTYA